MLNVTTGTGKTTTLTEIILQILTNIANSKILITTQSNSAANLIVQRLIQFKHVNPNNLLRLIGFNYAQKDGALPDDIEDYACTVDNLLPVSGSTIHERLSSVKRFRMVGIFTFSLTKNQANYFNYKYNSKSISRSSEHRQRLHRC